MILAISAIVGGLIVLVWSADRFVTGAAATARHFGMSALLIGMVIIGFGTSAPEIVVSVSAAMQGNPGIALGNAYGSNISNIGLILGLTALISPIVVGSAVLRKELPILLAITLFSVWQFYDGSLTRFDAIELLVLFSLLMAWNIWNGRKGSDDSFAKDVRSEFDKPSPLGKNLMWLIVGLLLLVISSRILVWGAVSLAQSFGVSDLIIGLTIIAIGTSLPELASSLVAIKKKEHDIALGNVLGSNLFNTLAVVGLAGVIHPMQVPEEIIYRDSLVMIGLTVSLFFFCYRLKRPAKITRLEGALLLLAFIGYTGYLVATNLTG